MKKIYDVIIIGGGPGGYSAALYCARAGLRTLLLEKLNAGGQMALSPEIDNYPGFDKGIDGFTLGTRMQKGAQRFGVQTILTEVISLQLSGKTKVAQTNDGTFLSRTIILAMGASHKELGLSNEKDLIGRGVSYCATCDGMFYKDESVVVVGGGNTAAADALYLSRFCQKIYFVHRRNTLRASNVYHEPLKNAPNIEFFLEHQVTQLLSQNTLTGVKIQHIPTKKEQDLPCRGIFIAIGQKPATELVKEQIDLDEHGYIVADETTRTNIPGVFAVGDVRTKKVRQIVTAVCDGAMAAYYVEKYLESILP